MRRIQKYFRIFHINWKELLVFEIAYKCLSWLLFRPILHRGFHLLIRVEGYPYITADNIGKVAANPLTIVAGLLLLCFLAFYFLVDVSAVLYLVDCSYVDKKLPMGELVSFAVKNSLRVFRWKNLPLIPVILFMAPLLNVGTAVSYLNSISIPSAVQEYLMWHRYVIPMIAVGILIIAVFMVRWMYVFHYFTIEKLGFREARARSVKLAHHTRIPDFLIMFLVQLVCYMSFELFTKLGIVITVFLIDQFSTHQVLTVAAMAASWTVIGFFLTLYVAFAVPLGYVVIGLLFYYHVYRQGNGIPHIAYRRGKHRVWIRGKYRKQKLAVTAVVLTAMTVYAFFLTSGRMNFNIEHMRTVEVTAHRGASANAPENTMSAFVAAVELGADWIELDVQQLGDGTIIVMHDASLKRTTGLDQNVWNVDYETVQQLDAGSWFSEEYAGEPVPLLSEVLEFARWNNVHLNIELKPTGHEVDFEAAVVEMIRDYHFEENCVVTSQTYESLERVKECAEEITTVYVMSIAYGNITRLSAADWFSVEAANISETMVERVHNQGGQILAWTVNNRTIMNRMIAMGVDNMITDDIHLAQECIYDSMTSNALQEYVDFLQQFQRVT